MNPTSKKIAPSAATLFTLAFFAMTASTAHAEDYCITSGAQAAHGCGYPTMEACRQAANGIGGMCMSNPSASSASSSSATNPGNALAYQAKKPHSKSELRHKKESAAQ